jgi:hypothetical protein
MENSGKRGLKKNNEKKIEQDFLFSCGIQI